MLKTILKILGVGVLCAIIAFALSYPIGMIIGSIGTDLSGAAAASHGLAKLGFGAIEKGGKGMRFGKVMLTFYGFLLGTLGASAVTFVQYVRNIIKERQKIVIPHKEEKNVDDELMAIKSETKTREVIDKELEAFKTDTQSKSGEN